VVSNHGGRQLEGAISPIEALPEIRVVAGKKLKILADSGCRRGTDIGKGLALGADFILVGRAAMFGVVAGVEEGAVHALSLLRAEVDRDLALLGCRPVVSSPSPLLQRNVPCRSRRAARAGARVSFPTTTASSCNSDVQCVY
jgi:L-lactate dehydrogenase (cytochrome)